MLQMMSEDILKFCSAQPIERERERQRERDRERERERERQRERQACVKEGSRQAFCMLPKPIFWRN